MTNGKDKLYSWCKCIILAQMIRKGGISEKSLIYLNDEDGYWAKNSCLDWRLAKISLLRYIISKNFKCFKMSEKNFEDCI